MLTHPGVYCLRSSETDWDEDTLWRTYTTLTDVLSALHRGEKRLVFCDSRAGVEALAAELRRAGTETFVSHSSLGMDERRRSEEAFAQGTNCLIVATSTLELGLDVGDLETV